MIRFQRREVAGLWIDPVCYEPSCIQAGCEEEVSCGVDVEGAGLLFGGLMSRGRQLSCRAIDRETGDAVVAPVRNVEESARGRDVDLCTIVFTLVTFGKRGQRLKGLQGSRCGVEAVGCDARAVFVRGVADLFFGVEEDVPGSRGYLRSDDRNLTGRERT